MKVSATTVRTIKVYDPCTDPDPKGNRKQRRASKKLMKKTTK